MYIQTICDVCMYIYLIIENLDHFKIGDILVTILSKDNPGHYCIYMYVILVTILSKDNPGHYCIYMYVYFKEVMVRCQKSNA